MDEGLKERKQGQLLKGIGAMALEYRKEMQRAGPRAVHRERVRQGDTVEKTRVSGSMWEGRGSKSEFLGWAAEWMMISEK